MSEVTATLGYTVNLGDFQSVRIDASIQVNTEKDVDSQIEVGLEAVKKAWVASEEKIGEALRELEMSSLKTDSITKVVKQMEKIQKDVDEIKKLTAKETF
jgi:hypothetical protein|tara:strand:- start:3941 stop:4240 length:300 start_codon:yes stop_codon:yes gene_type:complete